MAINEVFPNPTVKKVVFEVKFPNLFYIESKIGDLQLKVIERFPESALLHRRQLFFADLGPDTKLDDIALGAEPDTSKKLWQFRSPNKCILNVQTSSLDISSEVHKTYNLGESEKFRDMICFVVDAFLQIAPVPIFTRIGLRYIDHCPIPTKENRVFQEWYNSVFPLDRFSLADATEMDSKVVAKKGDAYIRYVESLQQSDGVYYLLMDFDGFQANVDPKNYLAVTDVLHQLISDEFERSIRQPVFEYMRKQAGA